jgi:predicted kinase
MSKLIAMMGISGSGKSTFSSEMEDAGYIRVNMDTLRKIWTGNIGDQSKNRQVADTCFALVEYLLNQEKDVIWDATSTKSDTRNRLLKIAKEQGAETELVVLMDSANIQLCRGRVRNDLKNSKDRADTIFDDSIMERQHASFISALSAIDKEGWGKIMKVGGEN